MTDKAIFYPTDDTRSASKSVSVPLLCWDIANPLLRKQQALVHDLDMFALLKARFDWQIATDLRPLLLDNLTVIVTDRKSHILWVSDSFSSLTGYQSAEVLGKNPSFLQGPQTSPKTQTIIRQKLTNGQSVAVNVLNYRKEGTPYWCRVDIQPLLNKQDECTHFIAFERELVA